MRHKHLIFIKYFFPICCFLATEFVAGQNAKSLINNFQEHTIQNLYEKIYVHLDRPDHVTGEILWFKIYCVDEITHRNLNLSKIAYAEILDVENNPVLQTKVELTEGSGKGSFYIPATLSTGTYRFRAYTNWMKNSDAGFFFAKSITIINTLKANEPAQKTSAINSLDIKFYPEGGQLIENINTRVAFQTLSAKGKGVDCAGAILNHANDTVVTFRTLKFGIGSFLFTPKPNEQYRVVINNPRVTVQTYSLPPILKSGYSIMVTDSLDGKIKAQVIVQGVPPFAQLFVHTRHSIKIAEAAHGTSNTVSFVIDRAKLGDGISHFTVLDMNNNPVCERLYFKKPTAILNLITEANQKEYGIRRKVEVTIKSAHNDLGDLSISVFRADSVSKENIINNLFLSSDLAGTVESPWYYFSDDKDVMEATDNLMLTHGWRRFKWENVLAAKSNIVQYLPETRGHLIQGRIIDNNSLPVADKIGYLASPGKKIRLYVSKSDAQGRVRFQMKDFQETGKIIAQTNYELDSLCHIEVDNPFSTNYTNWSAPAILLNPNIEEDLIKRSVSMQVQDAYFEDETYFRYTKLSKDSIPFYGKADEIYNLDDYTRFPVMEEVMREYVKGVWVRKKRDKFRFMVLDKPNSSIFSENPLTLLDGVPVFDINQVLEMDPLRIKKLEVLTRRYFFGPLDLNGLVSYSTYNGDLGGFELDPRSIKLDYEGLQRQREFYSPRYTDQALRSSRLPDQRFLLYWNPSVKLKPETKLEFYTSDVEGQFIIVVEGLSNSGAPGYSTTTFKVTR